MIAKEIGGLFNVDSLALRAIGVFILANSEDDLITLISGDTFPMRDNATFQASRI